MNNKWISPFVQTYSAAYLLFIGLDGLFSLFIDISEVIIGIGLSSYFFAMKYAIRCIPKDEPFFQHSVIAAFLITSLINISAVGVVLLMFISGGFYFSKMTSYFTPSMIIEYQLFSLFFIIIGVKYYGKQTMKRYNN
ncbi:MAG: hypothetical protein ACRC53_03625 [Plesiomonas sp.]|uniref:hypothetical protein n=1 Tax=Plesiomonas sp. TaxID=2486279 RepID=UPI003F3C2AD0